jgi:acetoacetyl-CoA synthetase
VSPHVTWLGNGGARPVSYGLWHRSTSDLEGYRRLLGDFFAVRAHASRERVLGSRELPGAKVVPGPQPNYAKHVLDKTRTAPV